MNIKSGAFIVWVTLTPYCLAGNPPNILFIMTDDHAYQAISSYGSNRNSTPNIDRLAREGMRFERCYVTNSICAPSRATILTGKYSHKNGVLDNYTEFDGSQMTFPKLLQQAGYQTALVGKWHLKSDPTGFDYWDRLPGQGKYYRPDFLTPAGKRAVPGHSTRVTTDLALDWLRQGRQQGQPFMLMVQYKAPHRRWDPAPEQVEAFADRTFAEPDTLMDDYATRGTAAHHAEMRLEQMNADSDLKMWGQNDGTRRWLYGHMTDDQQAVWEKYVDPRIDSHPGEDASDAEKRRAFYQVYMRDYLACVAEVDLNVGRILDYLDQSGLGDNTMVVYTSDQGFYLGEHGWFDKRFMYEQSLRTPLLVRWPGEVERATVNKHIVSNVDFAETFLEAVGAAVPAEMQGRSMLPLLRGKAPDDWRESFYYHYYEGPQKDHAVHRHEGVTTGRHKLIHFYELGEWELFDLENDPHELSNVYGQPEYATIQANLEAELSRLREELEVPPN